MAPKQTEQKNEKKEQQQSTAEKGFDPALVERYKYLQNLKKEKLHSKLDKIISPYLRWSIFVINVIFWLIGCVLIFLGVWAFLEKVQGLQIKRINTAIDVVTDIGIIIAMFGLIVFMIAFAGCVGVLRQNIRLLKIFRILLLAMFFLQLIAIVGLVAFTSWSVGAINDIVKEVAIKQYREDIDVQNLVDWVQRDLECCGIGEEGYLDWEANRYFKCSPTNKSPERCSVPYSCCQNPDDIFANIINVKCAYNVTHVGMRKNAGRIVWVTGCLAKINGFIKQEGIYVTLGACVYIFLFLIATDFVTKLTNQIGLFRDKWNKGMENQPTIDRTRDDAKTTPPTANVSADGRKTPPKVNKKTDNNKPNNKNKNKNKNNK